MKKIDLGQTITIVANIGVLLGIILLVYELDQNRDMMRAQIRNEISRSAGDLLTTGATNERLAAVMVHCAFGAPMATRLSWVPKPLSKVSRHP